MAEQNVPTQPPTRTDEQIVPRSQWLIIGKSNLLFNAQKIQKNPIFQISVDILSNTNFFQAVLPQQVSLASTCNQFWNTMKYDEKSGVYSCQIDEQMVSILVLSSSERISQLSWHSQLNRLSYLRRVNYVYQPWRAILNPNNSACGKTSISDNNQILRFCKCCGETSPQTNVDHAEPVMEEEEFIKGSRLFSAYKPVKRTAMKKITPLLIPYGTVFHALIIYYLARNNNIHRCPESAVHHTGDDFILGNLKFVPKGKTVEVFGMAIPDLLITEAIQQSWYYPKYLEMVAENTKKTP
ncbi:hypothetical protein Tco_0377282 [Tanacetum coccineum]